MTAGVAVTIGLGLVLMGWAWLSWRFERLEDRLDDLEARLVEGVPGPVWGEGE